jgi:hypothetical protein
MTISPNEYRWDFLGLSTDPKPTAETSENVTNGSTYYEPDTSKLYIYYDGTWYEKESTGGGGGDTSQFIEITDASVNYPVNNPTRVSLVDMPDGIYYINTSKSVCIGQVEQTQYRVSRGEWVVLTTRNSNSKYFQVFHYDQVYSGTVSILTGGVTGIYKHPRDVVDSLTSTSTVDALSANQGKVLNEKINVVALPLTLNEGTGQLTSQQTCGQIKALINEGKIFIPYVRLADTSLVEGGVVIITPENTGGNMVIYIFDGDSAQFILISLSADTDNDHFTGSLPS